MQDTGHAPVGREHLFLVVVGLLGIGPGGTLPLNYIPKPLNIFKF